MSRLAAVALVSVRVQRDLIDTDGLTVLLLTLLDTYNERGVVK